MSFYDFRVQHDTIERSVALIRFYSKVIRLCSFYNSDFITEGFLDVHCVTFAFSRERIIMWREANTLCDGR